MAAVHTIHIKDTADFNEKLKEAGSKLVIVDFYADWCGPCKNIAPRLEEFAGENLGTVVVLKVNVEECDEISEQYKISSMPTFIFIKGGQKLEEFSGANYDKLKSTAERLM